MTNDLYYIGRFDADQKVGMNLLDGGRFVGTFSPDHIWQVAQSAYWILTPILGFDFLNYSKPIRNIFANIFTNYEEI